VEGGAGAARLHWGYEVVCGARVASATNTYGARDLEVVGGRSSALQRGHIVRVTGPIEKTVDGSAYQDSAEGKASTRALFISPVCKPVYKQQIINLFLNGCAESTGF
jgi:hypothetical protein